MRKTKKDWFVRVPPLTCATFVLHKNVIVSLWKWTLEVDIFGISSLNEMATNKHGKLYELIPGEVYPSLAWKKNTYQHLVTSHLRSRVVCVRCEWPEEVMAHLNLLKVFWYKKSLMLCLWCVIFNNDLSSRGCNKGCDLCITSNICAIVSNFWLANKYLLYKI
jgi:hypothetical protein